MLEAIKRIICPVDVYDFQPEAAEYALTLAKALDAKITVVYVMEPLPSRYYYGKGFYDEVGENAPRFAEEGEAKQRAEAKMPEILSKYFTCCVDKSEVVFGQAAEQIVKIAGECPASMIVMASHGRSGLERIIHGSVTNKVLASAKIPVLVVQPSQ